MPGRIIQGIVLAIAMAIAAATTPVRAADDDPQAVKAAVASFHDALNVLFTGDAAPMKALWSHADDVSSMGPVGGRQIGWTQVEPHWDKQAARKLGGKVVVEDLRVTVAPTLAVAHSFERGENVVDGKPQPVFIRTTTTFRKESGQWKVIGHHTDTLAYLQPK